MYWWRVPAFHFPRTYGERLHCSLRLEAGTTHPSVLSDAWAAAWFVYASRIYSPVI
jgi:hypothetical protein